jgi:hypothetical protein
MLDIDFIINYKKRLESGKAILLPVYQTIGEFVRLRKQEFTAEYTPGAFLTAREIYDATGVNALTTMSAALLGNMWPNGAKTIRITKPDSLTASNSITEYFKKISLITTNAMDHPKARLSLAFDEFENDMGAFGTCGIAVYNTGRKDSPVAYKVWDVKTMLMDEDKNGVVDTVINSFKLTVRQIVDEYGFKKCSKRVQDLYNDVKLDEPVKVIHAIIPRSFAEAKKGGKSNKGMPIGSYHIEEETKHLLRESGYRYAPVVVGRFYKVPGEVYGRSPAMQALPDIVELNAVRESKMLATEKMLDPPLIVLDDGSLGGGEVDASPGALTVFNISGRSGNTDPIRPMYTVGEMQSTEKHIELLVQNITQAFYIDRLLDLNNDTRMTLGEAQIRNRIRGDSLTSIFDRRELEVLTPLTDITLGILLDEGLLGYKEGSEEAVRATLEGREYLTIPSELVRLMEEGREWYKIQFISPAKRMQQAEEMQGILTTMEIAGNVAQVDPSVLDWIDRDVLLRRATELGGGPDELVQDTNTVNQIREMRAEQQAAAADLENKKVQSEIARNLAQAGNMAKTGGLMDEEPDMSEMGGAELGV